MSSNLWKAYYEDDFDSFQHALEGSDHNSRARGGQSHKPVIGSPTYSGSSPSITASSRKTSGFGAASRSGHGSALTKADINARDATGQTLLHHAASSTRDTAISFASALIGHALVDLYLQDYENGWTALHRAFYFGNVTIARSILEQDAANVLGSSAGHTRQTNSLIKVKDREGLGPLDLYAATIKDRTLRPSGNGRLRSGSSDSDQDRPGPEDGDEDGKIRIPFTNVNCDQLFTFGSNKNVSLGFGDEDDRQFPERISVRRPEHLLRRFYKEHIDEHDRKWTLHDSTYRPNHVSSSEAWIDDIPYMPKTKALIIQDVQMAKFHSAVLTTDAESNLYMCGHGQGGRLGVGDEQTRYNFVCVETGFLAGKRIASVALGLNHSIALSDEGEIFSWGNNAFGQLGYSLPWTTSSDEDPISTIPRQIFGILKREAVVGIAASRIHSVAHTGSSLYTFGKNEGQLGIVDSDARSLEIQTTPRKVAASLFSSNIASVTAMEKATVCLLESHEVWVFANYGYAKVPFPLDGVTNYFLKQSFRLTTYDHEPNRIVKLTCGGDSICGLSSRGEIYTLSIKESVSNLASASTTNPSKIRSAITQPQRIWSPKKRNMAARDVGVDADGSIILSTEEGSVWKRTKRAKAKDATASGISDYKPKDYKFSRVPGLTRVLAVRGSSHGAYAAIRRDCDITKTQVVVEDKSLWKSLFPLLSLRQSAATKYAMDDELDSETRHRFWQGHRKPDELLVMKRAISDSKDIEKDLTDLEERGMEEPSFKYDALVTTTTSNVRIPVHRFLLSARSKVVRRGFRDLCETSTFTIPDLAISEMDAEGQTIVVFQGLDILTVVDFVIYIYTDSFIDFWHLTRNAPRMAHRYRQVRIELMKVATKLEMSKLEAAARQMVQPRSCLDMDFEVALQDPALFYDGDVVIQLEDDEIRVHSALLRARCPFFEGLFMGRAGGRWLAAREEEEEVNVDLEHITSKTFNLVLRHMYADTGPELFDSIVSVGLEDFVDSVMDVLSAANELMLDRLSQICQEVIGRFVNARNVCGLLNAVSPSSIHELKDAGLEYLCLSLETALQGHHLNELDEDLLAELDDVVRENQLACMPFAKSGRADLLLHERNPGLAAAIDRNIQSKIDGVKVRSRHQVVQTHISFAEDAPSPVRRRTRRKSSTTSRLPQNSSLLEAKASFKDEVFTMDGEADEDALSPEVSPFIRPMSKRGASELVSSNSPNVGSPAQDLEPPALTSNTSSPTGQQTSTPGKPWSLTAFTSTKTDMKDIMAQAVSTRTSSLSQSIAAGRSSSASTPAPPNLTPSRLSQKERKKLQQSQQSVAVVDQVPKRPDPSPTTAARPPSAWQTISKQKLPSLNDTISQASPSDSSKPSSVRSTSTPQLTMRQTVANAKSSESPTTPVIGPAGQTPTQKRTTSDIRPPMPKSPEQPTPRSIRHQPRPDAEASVGLSMSEIVAQEQLAKKATKEAVAKRDLQDIQAEQEFEEWWNQESARVQEAEKRSATAVASSSKKKHRPRGGKAVKKGKEKEGGDVSKTPRPAS